MPRRKADILAFKYRSLILTTCYIAGIGFKTKAAIAHAMTLQVGELFTLQREKENEFDSNAILVVADGFGPIGYVQKSHNDVPATLMDHGYPIHAALLDVASKAKLNQKYRVGLYLYLV